MSDDPQPVREPDPHGVTEASPTSPPGEVAPAVLATPATADEDELYGVDDSEAAETAVPRRTRRRDVKEKTGLGHRLYHGNTQIPFTGRRNVGFGISAFVILVGIIGLAINGLNFGIDFRGGTAWEVRAPQVSVTKARDELRPLGLAEARIVRLGTDTLRVQTKLRGTADVRQAKTIEVREKLSSLVGGKEVSVNTVGPSWGGEITAKARNALVLFFLAIAAFLAIRFEWRMAAAALVAVVHDIVITVGIYALAGFEVTPASVIAFLTILGYSLYDTVVVFDRIDENVKSHGSSGRATYSDIVDLSMNQTLMRSLNTSLVAILPILSVLVIGSLVLGATTLEDFGLALFVGLLTGAYSSIAIAAPVLAMLKEREPRWRAVRSRLEARGELGTFTGSIRGPSAAVSAGVTPRGLAGGVLRPTGTAVAVAFDADGSPVLVGTDVQRPVIQPRARKKTKKR